MANKWRKRARKWRKEARAYKGYYIDTDLALKTERIQNALSGPASGAAAALNKAEELRRDNVRLATELARVQGVCETTQARLVSLQKSDMLDLLEKKRLLAWQRGVREEAQLYAARGQHNAWDLLQAIKAEPKEET